MPMIGADPDKLEDLAKRFQGASDELRSHLRLLRPAAHDAPWFGPDADTFRGALDGFVQRNVENSARTLSNAAETLRRNISEQRQASAAGGGRFAASPDGGAGSAGAGAGGGGGFWSGPARIHWPRLAPGSVYNPINFFKNGVGGVKGIAGFLGKPPGWVPSWITNRFPSFISGNAGKLQGVSNWLRPIAPGVDAGTAIYDFTHHNWLHGTESSMNVVRDALPPLNPVSAGIRVGEWAYHLDPNWDSHALTGLHTLIHDPGHFVGILGGDAKDAGSWAWDHSGKPVGDFFHHPFGIGN